MSTENATAATWSESGPSWISLPQSELHCSDKPSHITLRCCTSQKGLGEGQRRAPCQPRRLRSFDHIRTGGRGGAILAESWVLSERNYPWRRQESALGLVSAPSSPGPPSLPDAPREKLVKRDPREVERMVRTLLVPVSKMIARGRVFPKR